MDYEPARPTGYTAAQIVLHWVIVLLVLFQLVFGEDMGRAFRAVQTGEAMDGGTALSADLHLWVGVAVLVFAAIRLVTRLGYGAPPAPAGTSPLQARLADAMHWLFYVLLFVVPVSGLVAWFVTPAVGELHELSKPAFIVLILGHAGAALYHQFVVKDGVLRRMLVPSR